MYKIILDAGHGGNDGGAAGGGYAEKDINLVIVDMVRYYLNHAPDITCFNTRIRDEFLSLADRVNRANVHKSGLFVSIHCNSHTSPEPAGVETYCYKFGGPAEKAARFIHAELLALGLFNDRGVKEGNFQVIRNTIMPGVLCELGFISNTQDRSKLIKPDYQVVIAKALTTGVIKYIMDINSNAWGAASPETKDWLHSQNIKFREYLQTL